MLFFLIQKMYKNKNMKRQKCLKQNSASHHEKSLMKPGTEGSFFNTVKAIYDKPAGNITLRKTEIIFFKIRQGCLFSPSLFNIVLEILARAIGQEKMIKKAMNMKRSKIILVYRWYDPILEDLKDCTKFLRADEQIQQSNKIYQSNKIINIIKIVLLYTNNGLAEKVIKKIIHFSVASQKIPRDQSNFETAKRKHRGNIWSHRHKQTIPSWNSSSIRSNSKNQQMGQHQIKKKNLYGKRKKSTE